jgi:hypothetical protein
MALSEIPSGFRGPQTLELWRLERALDLVARPVADDDWLTHFTPADLMELGVYSAGSIDRKALIERLWGRKRLLLRQLGVDGDWGPMPPVA